MKIPFACFVVYISNQILAKEYSHRTIFSEYLPGNALATTDSKLIGPAEIDDGCERQYPLPPENEQRLPLSLRRYRIIPDLIDADPPPQYLEVMGGGGDGCSLKLTLQFC